MFNANIIQYMMKHTSYTLFIYITALLLTLTGCQDGNDFGTGFVALLEKPGLPPVEDKISISPSSLFFTISGGVKTVQVTANNTWAMSSPNYQGTSSGWLTLTPSIGNFQSGTDNISIETSSNTAVESRTATIIFSCGTSAPVTLEVTQSGLEKHTTASPTEINDIDSPDQSTRTITVMSNETWTATLSNEAKTRGWSIDKTSGGNNGTVTVTVAKNTTDQARTATVTVKGNDSNDETTVTITQTGITLDVSAPTTFTASGSSQDLTVTCNTNDWTGASSMSWCTVQKKDNKTLAVTCTPNTTTDQRKATVIVQAGDVPKSIEVIQEPNTSVPYTKVTSETSLDFDLDAGTKYIEIESNEEWEVSKDNASWLASVTTEKNANGGRVTVTAKANTTETSHTAIITIKGNTSGDRTPVTVTQKAVELSVSPSTKNFDKPNADSESFIITCNTTWIASSSDNSWCKVEKKGDSVLTVSVTENTSITERTAKVTVQAGEVTRTIDITQAGTSPYILINGEKSLTVSNGGETMTITVSTNDGPFTVSGNPAWCSVTNITDNSFELKVEPNGTLSKRTATITVVSQSGKTDTLTVTQKAGNIGIEDYE